MISESDFIIIPYTSDMSLVGINYACKLLPFTDINYRTIKYKRLRSIVGQTAVELALKRNLNYFQIPHTILRLTPFTDPDNYDINIGGRRCIIKSFMVTQKKLIQTIRKEPNRLLQAQALVGIDDLEDKHIGDQDILIFAYLTALVTPNYDTLRKAISAVQPIYMIHTLPKKWTHPKKGKVLGVLTIKSNMDKVIKLELGGYNIQRKFQTEDHILNPQTQTVTEEGFSSLTYLSSPSYPDESISIHSSLYKESYLIEPRAWQNIWVYGMEIIFGGYITCNEYRKNAKRVPKGTRVFSYFFTPSEYFTLPFRYLHPLADLYQQAKDWYRN